MLLIFVFYFLFLYLSTPFFLTVDNYVDNMCILFLSEKGFSTPPFSLKRRKGVQGENIKKVFYTLKSPPMYIVR